MDNMEAAYSQTMLGTGKLNTKLKNFYLSAVEVYTSGEHAKGCMIMSTAVASAANDADIQSDLLNAIHNLDKKFKIFNQQYVQEIKKIKEAVERPIKEFEKNYPNFFFPFFKREIIKF